MLTTVEYTKKESNALQRRELKNYEAEIDDITAEEREGLHKWVADGYSPYENPCLFCDGDGYTMDYIHAIRIGEDMRLTPEAYIREYETESTYVDDSAPF